MWRNTGGQWLKDVIVSFSETQTQLQILMDRGGEVKKYKDLDLIQH